VQVAHGWQYLSQHLNHKANPVLSQAQPLRPRFKAVTSVRHEYFADSLAYSIAKQLWHCVVLFAALYNTEKRFAFVVLLFLSFKKRENFDFFENGLK